MANAIKWEAAGTSRSTGISASDNWAAASGLLSSEIDNATNLDRWLKCQVAVTPESATAGQVLFYILYAVDGTNYERGATNLQPEKAPADVVPYGAAASAQLISTNIDIPISPYKFKILIWNVAGAQCDAVTLLAYTHNEEVQ